MTRGRWVSDSHSATEGDTAMTETTEGRQRQGIGKLASNQVRRALKQSPDEGTTKVLMRALPELEIILDKLCAHSSPRDDPDAMIYLLASRNPRPRCCCT